MATETPVLVNYEDRETELAVLMTAIIRRAALVDLLSLNEDDFYSAEGRALHAAIVGLNADNQVIDLLAVKNALISRGSFEPIGGQGFFASFLTMQTTMNHEYAMQCLRNMANRRKLYQACTAVRQDLGKRDSVDEAVNYLQATARALLDLGEQYATFAELSSEGIGYFADTGDRVTTGIADIDRKITGLFPGELVVIAARPGIGKTTLAEQIAANIAETQSVLFVSLEMPAKHLCLKLISRASRVDSHRIRQGGLTQQETDDIHGMFPGLSRLDMVIVDDAMLFSQVESRIVRYLERKRARLVVLDYIQLVTVPGKNKPRYEQIGDVSRMLKRVAKQYDCTVLALAQLKRSAENVVPELSDFRESGDIEQDADVIMFLHDPNKRDAKYADGGPVQLFIAKNRNGRVGMCELFFNKKFSEFAPIDNSAPADYCPEPEWGARC